MKIFKEIMAVLCRPFGTFGFGWAIGDLIVRDYKSAAWILFVVSILFIVGYFAERLSNIKEDF